MCSFVTLEGQGQKHGLVRIFRDYEENDMPSPNELDYGSIYKTSTKDLHTYYKLTLR